MLNYINYMWAAPSPKPGPNELGSQGSRLNLWRSQRLSLPISF